MPIAQLPVNKSLNVVDRLKGTDMTWTRGLATGSLITGAVLLATGRRKAGLAITAVGVAAALLEDVEGTKEIWESIPGYIESGQKALAKVERFVEELAEQGERVSRMLSKQMA